MAESIQLLKTKMEVQMACSLLSEENVIALDVEGVNLGKSGTISLIQVATKDNNYFIFDILQSECDMFQCGLKELLTREDVKKLMFDCRKDSESLKFLHHIDLNGVIDIQLLEIMTRTELPGSSEARDRLKGFLHRGNVDGSPQLYQRVLRLSSLDSCMDKYNLGDVQLKKHIRECFRNDVSFWMKRPLPPAALQYAVQDVSLLFQLAQLMASPRQALFNNNLIESSRRYAKSILIPPQHSCYSNHPLLPWGILDYLPSPQTGNNLPCVCCNVSFPKHLLPKNNRRCEVCRAIDIKLATERNWNNNEDDECDYGYYSDDGGCDIWS